MSSYPRQEGIPEAEQLNDHRIQMLNQPNEGEDQTSEHSGQRFHRRMALIIFVGVTLIYRIIVHQVITVFLGDF